MGILSERLIQFKERIVAQNSLLPNSVILSVPFHAFPCTTDDGLRDTGYGRSYFSSQSQPRILIIVMTLSFLKFFLFYPFKVVIFLECCVFFFFLFLYKRNPSAKIQSSNRSELSAEKNGIQVIIYLIIYQINIRYFFQKKENQIFLKVGRPFERIKWAGLLLLL